MKNFSIIQFVVAAAAAAFTFFILFSLVVTLFSFSICVFRFIFKKKRKTSNQSVRFSYWHVQQAAAATAYTLTQLVSVEMTPLCRINMAVTLTGSRVFQQRHTHTHTHKSFQIENSFHVVRCVCFSLILRMCECVDARVFHHTVSLSHLLFVFFIIFLHVSPFFLLLLTHTRTYRRVRFREMLLLPHLLLLLDISEIHSFF